MVCNDPHVIEQLSRFVPVVDSANNYVNYYSRPQTDKLQYQLVERIMSQTVYRQISGAQGLYIVTPSGRMLAGTTRHSAPDVVLAEMQRGVAAYYRLSRSERLLAREPNAATDRVVTSDSAQPPAGGLILRVVTRGLADSGVSLDDTRHRSFYKLDHVWLNREQARSLLPATLRVGERAAVRGSAAAILARLHLGVFIQPNPAWNAEDVRQFDLTSEVIGVKGDLAQVRLDGSARYEANSQYNNRRYTPRLLGVAAYNSRENRFTAFDLVAVGTHTMGTVGEDARIRGTQSIPLGVLFTLNGNNYNDQTPPHYFKQYAIVARVPGRSGD